MSKLPSIPARDALHVFEQLGYERDRQRGSHIVLRHRDPPHRRLVVPDHDPIAKGTLRALLREAGLTVEEFVALL